MGGSVLRFWLRDWSSNINIPLNQQVNNTQIAIQMDTVKESDASDCYVEVSLLNVLCTTTQPYDILGGHQSELNRMKYSSSYCQTNLILVEWLVHTVDRW